MIRKVGSNSGDQYPRTEHSVKLTVKASDRVSDIFKTEVPFNSNAAKAEWAMQRKVTVKAKNPNAGAADHAMVAMLRNKACMAQAPRWNPSAHTPKRHKH